MSNNLLRHVLLMFALLLICVRGNTQTTLVVGEKIAADARGVAIYRVQANHVFQAYKLQGDGDTLVLVNGVGASMQQWPTAFLDALSAHYQLLLLDNRGIGYSTTDNTPFDARLLADDLLALLDALHIRKAHLLGNGFGGLAVQSLLLSNPGRVDKAVIIGATTDGSNAQARMKGHFVPGPVTNRQVEALAQWRTPQDLLARVNTPVLLVSGTADRVNGTEGSKTLANTIPGAWLVQFRNGGYKLVQEVPLALAQSILAFLQTSTTVALKDTR